jgi:hypothetical protein
MYYQMTFDAFNVLVEELTPFLKSECFNHVRPQLEVRKIVAIVLYKFAHGLSPKHISNRFDVCASIVCNYVDIVCDVLCNKDKLFDKYIKTPTRNCLLHIVQQFENLTILPNICGAIDGTHIPLVDRPNRKYIIAVVDCYNRKRFHNIVF